MNRSYEERLPELIEVYDLQRGGLVGRSSFKAKARPTSVDEMQLEQLRNEMREQAAYDEGFKPTGVVPDFGDSPYRSQYVQMGPPVAGLHSMGSFSVKARPQAAKMSSFRQAKNASLISARSPADFEPWVDMEQSFDTSATAPSYRPSKVIRSLEAVKYRDCKPFGQCKSTAQCSRSIGGPRLEHEHDASRYGHCKFIQLKGRSWGVRECA